MKIGKWTKKEATTERSHKRTASSLKTKCEKKKKQAVFRVVKPKFEEVISHKNRGSA